MAEEEDVNPNLFDETAANTSLDIADMDTSLNEDDIAAASNELQSLLTHMGSESHQDALGTALETSTPDQPVKQEFLSPAKNVPDAPSAAADAILVNLDEKGSEGDARTAVFTLPLPLSQSTPQHHNIPNHNSSSSSGRPLQQHHKKLRTELKVQLQRLSPATVSAAQGKSCRTSVHPYGTRHNRVSSKKLNDLEPQSSASTRSNLNNQVQRVSKSSAILNHRGGQISEASRRNLTSHRVRAKESHRPTVSTPRGAKRNLDDLSREELKKLLIKSQASVQSLSNKLMEREKSENEVFGRLIGKMIGGVKSHWRLEGLKLHIHNLVCETILQDMEESES